MELKLEQFDESSYDTPKIEMIMGMNAAELDALEKEIKQKLEIKRAEYERLKLSI